MTILIPCDYKRGDSATCEKGTLLIYGEMPVPPRWITCPNCKGTGFYEVEKEELKRRLLDLEEDKIYIDEQIAELKGYLDDL